MKDLILTYENIHKTHLRQRQITLGKINTPHEVQKRSIQLEEMRSSLKEEIETVYHEHSLWTGFFKDIDGIGILDAAKIIAEIDFGDYDNIIELTRDIGIFDLENSDYYNTLYKYDSLAPFLIERTGPNLIRARGEYYDYYKKRSVEDRNSDEAEKDMIAYLLAKAMDYHKNNLEEKDE